MGSYIQSVRNFSSRNTYSILFFSWLIRKISPCKYFPKYWKRHQKPFVRKMSCRSWEKVAVNISNEVDVKLKSDTSVLLLLYSKGLVVLFLVKRIKIPPYPQNVSHNLRQGSQSKKENKIEIKSTQTYFKWTFDER